MNKLKIKAKSGVTLVELLVVILIVTILSVSMLPMLQPFVTEAQYAAEAVPVIGNLRTKIGLYQYDKGYLPNAWNIDTSRDEVETWMEDTAGSGDVEKYTEASYTLTQISAERSGPVSVVNILWDGVSGNNVPNKVNHLGLQCDVDYQDLKGKRSKPIHYQYYVISATNNPSYVVGCFGDGKGFKPGTGYAVCELNFTKARKKYIGTWKRYKSQNDEAGSIVFNSANVTDSNGKPIDCFVPSASDFETTHVPAADSGTGEPAIIALMRAQGWEF